MLFSRRFSSPERIEAETAQPLGVVDIGSNSVRLVVYEGPFRAPTPIFNEKELCGLGRTVATTGRLCDDAIQCALTALRRFRAIADTLNVSTLRVIATAAARDAENGPDFIAAAETLCKVPVEVLSGQDEARISAQGVMMGVPDADGIAADLGGGSVELIDIKNGQVQNAITLPLGGLRLIDVTEGKLDKAAKLIDQTLDKVPFLGDGRGRTFYAVGGTWRAIAKLHMAESDYPLNVMHEYQLEAAEASAFSHKLHKARQLSSVEGIAKISKQRKQVVPFGALLMEKLLERSKVKTVQFSVFGVREGIFYSMLDEKQRAKDPLLSYCERLAELYSRSAAHARELCVWTDDLFARNDLAETEEEKRLRHAACLISDIGWRAHPDYRGDQSLDAVAHAALSGIDHPGRIFLALSIYFRHAGRGELEGEKLSVRLRKSADKNSLKRARIIGSAVRAAHMLSVGVEGRINESSLSYDDNKLIWNIPKKLGDLDGARLRRRFATLASLIDCEAEVRVV